MLKNLDWLYKRVKISPYNNKWEWILLKDFIYEIGYKWSWDIINIPAGFVFNGASLPRLFHIISTPMSSDTIISILWSYGSMLSMKNKSYFTLYLIKNMKLVCTE